MALGVVAVIGGVQVLNYNSLASSANNGPPGTYEGTQFTQSSANFWRYGWIAFAAGGAAALAAGVLTW